MSNKYFMMEDDEFSIESRQKTLSYISGIILHRIGDISLGTEMKNKKYTSINTFKELGN